MNYLVKKNHRYIAYINIIENYNFAFQRQKGYINSLKKFNIKYNDSYYLSVKTEEPEQSATLIKKMLISLFKKINWDCCKLDNKITTIRNTYSSLEWK